MRFPRRFSFTRQKTDAMAAAPPDDDDDDAAIASTTKKQQQQQPADRYAWTTLSDHDKYILESFQKCSGSSGHHSLTNSTSLHATDSLLGMDDDLHSNEDDDDLEFFEDTGSRADDDHDASTTTSSGSSVQNDHPSFSYTVEDSLLIDKQWQRVKTTTSTTALGGKILLQLHKTDPSCLLRMQLPQFTRQTPRYVTVCELLVQTTDMMVALLGPDMLQEEYTAEWNHLGRTCAQEGIPLTLLPAAVAHSVRSVLNSHNNNNREKRTTNSTRTRTNSKTPASTSRSMMMKEESCTSAHVEAWIRALEACIPCMQQEPNDKKQPYFHKASSSSSSSSSSSKKNKQQHEDDSHLEEAEA